MLKNKHKNFPPHLSQAKISPLEIKVERDNFEDAFKRFKALFQKERIIGRLKEKQFYEKPSEKKRRKRREAKERRLMVEAREKMMQTGEWERRAKKKQVKRQRKIQNKQNKQVSEDLL